MMRRQAGFTLVEMLIAMVVLAVAFSAVLMSINENVRTLLYLENKTTAIWVADDVMTQAELGLLSTGAGKITMLNHTWYWRVQTKPTENEQVEEILVSVSEQPNESAVVSLNGY